MSPHEAQAHTPTILVVDDAPTNLTLLAGLLDKTYRVKLASSGAKALELAQRSPPDLVLLDLMMPGMDGYEVCQRLKQDPRTSHIPVIFLTAMQEPEDETRGFEVGGADYIHKPISPAVVKARVKTHLQNKAFHDYLNNRNVKLQTQLETQMAQLDHLRDSTLFIMISFAEFRDEDTGNHVKRTQEYVRVLATHLWGQGLHHDVLNPDSIQLIAKSAPLHDIGKVAIPDSILLKPGKLTAEEFEVMRGHPLHGWEMLNRAALRVGEETDFLAYAMEIARSHHEKWDGSGYPDGLRGQAIPLSARLMAVADVYDALISRRPYKEPFSHEVAMAFINEGRGKHFDGDIVDALHATQAMFIDIASQWKD
ncbi:two-component system response regulator [Aquabacterium sp.]|uniref:response regulator n=1 Tax=Aquabacterium sp. TaxID=1872578 RepID=UPI0024895636|nr:two-component system response regulator [Aquabacterium sp.]MDI1259134.1 two-component system response regulator [Aquabacterium sp.]